MIINENETIDDLQNNGLKIIQSENEFKFGIDAILLSGFAKLKRGSKVLDIGTGTGIVPILMTAKSEACEFVGLEIQPQMADMADRSVKMNKLENVKIICDDIKNWEKTFEKASFDAITSNPPYMDVKSGLKNDNESLTISRHEIKCTLEDIIYASSQLLKPKGALFMIHRPGRVADLIELMRKYELEPKIMRFVHSNQSSRPSMVLVKATRKGNRELIIERPLFVYDENGEYSSEVIEIYGGQI